MYDLTLINHDFRVHSVWVFVKTFPNVAGYTFFTPEGEINTAYKKLWKCTQEAR